MVQRALRSPVHGRSCACTDPRLRRLIRSNQISPPIQGRTDSTAQLSAEDFALSALIPLCSLIQGGRKKLLHSLDENDPDPWLTEHPHVEPMLQWVLQRTLYRAINAGSKLVTRKIVHTVCLMWKGMSEEEKASGCTLALYQKHQERRAKSARQPFSGEEAPLDNQQHKTHAEGGRPRWRPRGTDDLSIASRLRSSHRTSSTISGIGTPTRRAQEEEEGEDDAQQNAEGELE